MRKEKKGAGMTVEEITYHQTAKEQRAFRDAMFSAWDKHKTGFEVVVAPIEEWAREQLAAKGIEEAMNRARDSLPGRAGEHAKLVLRYIGIVRKAIDDRNAQEAARFAINIGRLFARIQMAIEWEEYALHGEKRKRNFKPRGLSRVSQKILDVLNEKGRDLPSKIVRRELERDGLELHLAEKEFASQVSRVRKRLD